ncbi:MAG TPA: ComEA family DNA-binding protein [Acidimicrobiia bacterium]
MGEMRGRVAVVVVLAAMALSVGVLMGRLPAPAPTSTSDSALPAAQAPADTVTVHVSGMVVSPGVVDVPVDAIVAEAVEAAGGLLSGALVDQINLAAPIVPGEQIVVPGPTEATVGGGGDDGVLSINQASPTDLESLPGVGPVLAERIVSHRETNGRFETVEDLLEVPGIGEAKLEAIRDLVKP